MGLLKFNEEDLKGMTVRDYLISNAPRLKESDKEQEEIQQTTKENLQSKENLGGND